MMVEAAKPQSGSPGVWPRIALLVFGGLALVTGIWGGLARLGWPLPLPSSLVVPQHGLLMVGGFLGTLIGLERAVALGSWWAYGAPVLAGTGSTALILGLAPRMAAFTMTCGSVAFVLASLAIVRRQPQAFTAMLAGAGAAWAIGNGVLLAGRPVFEPVLWWVAFLFLTIAGERLELSRLARPSRLAPLALLGTCALFGAGVLTTLWWREIGSRLAGAGLLAGFGWLVSFDIARRNLRQRGLARYIAVSLLGGYAWLAVSGSLLLAFGAIAAGPRYDAALHAFFVGFVFSMIFGHAPIIFPSLLGIGIPYHSLFYLPLALLHASLFLRVAGDLGGLEAARLWGGALNAASIVLFIATIAGNRIFK